MLSSEQLGLDQISKGASIHVIGANGVEGAAVTSFLLGEGFSNLTVHAMCEGEKFERELLKSFGLKDPHEKKHLLEKARKWEVVHKFGEKYLDGVADAEIIFAPQSWELHPEANAPLNKLRDRLYNIIHLYLELAPCKTIGVTGSDGKTTTAHMIEHLLKESNRKVWISGNYRHGAHVLEQIRDLDPDGYLVLEISNRHLNFGLTKTPDLAVVTNVTQNHISEYDNFEHYIETKSRIIGDETIAVLNLDNPHTRSMARNLDNDFFFSREQETNGAWLKDQEIVMGGESLCRVSDISLPGEHNIENTLAAVTVAKLVGLTPKEIRAGVKSFASVKERLERIGEIGGVEIINDLAATSMESGRRGVIAFKDRDLSVVIGGDTKGAAYEPLAETLKELSPRIFALRSEVSATLIELGVDLEEYDLAEDAIIAAHKNTPKGGVLLISPAGAFFASRYLKKPLSKVISLLQ